MASVSGVRSGAVLPSGGARPTGGTGFTVPDSGAGRGAAAAVSETVPAMLAGMLSLQELQHERVEDRQARRRGHDLLAALAALQRALLGDVDDPEVLPRLAGLVTDVPQALDPRLNEAVAGVVLRARIELARRGG